MVPFTEMAPSAFVVDAHGPHISDFAGDVYAHNLIKPIQVPEGRQHVQKQSSREENEREGEERQKRKEQEGREQDEVWKLVDMVSGEEALAVLSWT